MQLGMRKIPCSFLLAALLLVALAAAGDNHGAMKLHQDSPELGGTDTMQLSSNVISAQKTWNITKSTSMLSEALGLSRRRRRRRSSEQRQRRRRSSSSRRRSSPSYGPKPSDNHGPCMKSLLPNWGLSDQCLRQLAPQGTIHHPQSQGSNAAYEVLTHGLCEDKPGRKRINNAADCRKAQQKLGVSKTNLVGGNAHGGGQWTWMPSGCNLITSPREINFNAHPKPRHHRITPHKGETPCGSNTRNCICTKGTDCGTFQNNGCGSQWQRILGLMQQGACQRELSSLSASNARTMISMTRVAASYWTQCLAPPPPSPPPPPPPPPPRR